MPCHLASRPAEPQPHMCCPRKQPIADLGAVVMPPALLPEVPRTRRWHVSEKLAVSRQFRLQDPFESPPIPPPRLPAVV